MPTREHNPVPPQDQRRSKPMQTSPDDDEAQVADQTHAGDLSEPQQARRRRDQEMEREREKVDQIEDEEAEDDEDEADGKGPRS